MGFKSVFKYTSCPHVSSNSFRFKVASAASSCGPCMGRLPWQHTCTQVLSKIQVVSTAVDVVVVVIVVSSLLTIHCSCSFACRTSQARRANGVCAGETGTLLGPVSNSLWRRSSRPRFRFHHASFEYARIYLHGISCEDEDCGDDEGDAATEVTKGLSSQSSKHV